MEYYTEEATSSLNNDSQASELQNQYAEEEDDDFCRYRKDQIYTEIDFMKRKTKICCSLGPSTADVKTIIELFDAGMSLARFNMSHGDSKSNGQLFKKFQEAKRLRPYKTCALMMDVRGRTIRTSKFPEPVTFAVDDRVEFRTDGFDLESSKQEIQINYFELPPVMRDEDIVYLGDQGDVYGQVVEIARTSFVVQIKVPGSLGAGNHVVKIPGNRIQQLPVLTFEDRVDFREILGKYTFDYISVPQIQSGRDIQELKLLLGQDQANIQVIAKIDTIEAINNLPNILKHADGIIILRNELGIELSPEKLVLAQRWMVQQANAASIPVFLQSQVIEAMVNNDLAGTRQQVADVSQSVIEGADCFILSHETSVGKVPIDSTVLLAKAIAEAENVYDHEQAYQDLRKAAQDEGKNGNVLDMLCTTATQIALDNNVDLFVCLTETGKIARYLAKQRPMQTILACSTKPQVVRQMNSSRGVIGYKVPAHIRKHMDNLMNLVLKVAKEQGFCLGGNKVMIFTVDQEGTPNESVSFKMIEVDEE